MAKSYFRLKFKKCSVKRHDIRVGSINIDNAVTMFIFRGEHKSPPCQNQTAGSAFDCFCTLGLNRTQTLLINRSSPEDPERSVLDPFSNPSCAEREREGWNLPERNKDIDVLVFRVVSYWIWGHIYIFRRALRDHVWLCGGVRQRPNCSRPNSAARHLRWIKNTFRTNPRAHPKLGVDLQAGSPQGKKVTQWE